MDLVGKGFDLLLHVIDRGLGSHNPPRPLTPLVPTRHNQLPEIDQMIGMIMGYDQQIDIRATRSRRDELLAYARSTIYQNLTSRYLHQMRRPQTRRCRHRTARTQTNKTEIIHNTVFL